MRQGCLLGLTLSTAGIEEGHSGQRARPIRDSASMPCLAFACFSRTSFAFQKSRPSVPTLLQSPSPSFLLSFPRVNRGHIPAAFLGFFLLLLFFVPSSISGEPHHARLYNRFIFFGGRFVLILGRFFFFLPPFPSYDFCSLCEFGATSWVSRLGLEQRLH